MPFQRYAAVLLIASLHGQFLQAQDKPNDPAMLARARMVGHGYVAEDLADLVVKDHYRDEHTGVEHTYLRQRWQGIEVFNGDIAVHQAADRTLIRMNNGAWPYAAKTAERPEPKVTAAQALAEVLRKDGQFRGMPALAAAEDGGKRLVYEGTAFNNEPVTVQLMYLPTADTLRLVWNVNYFQPDGAHWWNVRISAITGMELERNDWVSQCGLPESAARSLGGDAAAPPPPAAAMDYNVYPVPVESPGHGARALRNAPWGAGGAASPYGWHDTNGAAGAEYTITRGNNVYAKEDVSGTNGNGYSPDGGASLTFDFPINFTQQPASYQDAAITNLFYWNNMMHDVWYQYGFNEASGNFQSNNYGRGGTAGDHVLADAQDGSGTNNANFATPPDGSSPRMQMYLWTYTTPKRDGDLDGGIISHEYGHGISTRLVGGPSNVNCLNNLEEMGEGWSDFFGLMMTMKTGDTRTTQRGIGTYVIGQPATGTGIRPAPYCTDFGVNNFTYAATTQPAYQETHDIGFIWCTMLWEMTWDLIDQYGFSPDLYNGTGGNNIAMRLVIDGLKLTPCSPGFVDARNAILQADQVANGGANQNLIWAAFARRGLGYSAQQGSSNSLNDQVAAFNMPLQKNIGVSDASPAGAVFACANTPVQVVATVRNNGLQAQSGFSLRYAFDGGAFVTEAFPGTLPAGASATFTFAQPIAIATAGAHSLVVATVLTGDEYPADDAVTNAITATFMASVPPPVLGSAQGGVVPAGWTLQNPDNATTWETSAVPNGPLCAATTAWMINYYGYASTGQEDRLLTPPIDLSGTTGARLTFHHAYARYSASYYDAFRVDISSDCGSSWTTLYQAQGAALATAPDNTGSTWKPANCSQWAAHDIDLGAYDGATVVVRFIGINGYGQRLYLDNVKVAGTGVAMAAKAFLSGPYNAATHLMNDQLRANGLVPATEPYTALGYTLPGGGGETAAPALLAASGNDAPVDWVVVELRNAANPAQVVAARCALLQRDGDLMGADGSPRVRLNAPAGSYIVAVRHRNHLACMTAAGVALGGTLPLVDLGAAATATYGTDARRPVDGKMALWSGNVIADGKLQYTGPGNDREPVLQAVGSSSPNATASGYLQADVNMDGAVKYTGQGNDRDALLQNLDPSLPTGVRVQQLQ